MPRLLPLPGGRLGARLLVLFALCALLPLFVAGTYGWRSLDAFLERRDGERLEELAGRYGLALVDRLRAIDQVVRSVLEGRDEALARRLARLRETGAFSRIVERRIDAAPAPGSPVDLPWPDDAQRRALEAGATALLWELDDAGRTRVYLVRAIAGEPGWLYAEFRPAWLWGDARDLPPGLDVTVATRSLEPLYSSGDPPVDFAQALRSALEKAGERGRGEAPVPRRRDREWSAHYWEAYLQGAYAVPPFHVIAWQARPTLHLELEAMRIPLGGFLLLALSICGWLASRTIGHIRRTIGDATRAARGIARGEAQLVARPASRDELAELADAMNAAVNAHREKLMRLQALGELDAILLGANELEQAIEGALPHIARTASAHAAAVLLLDPDAAEHARMYEHVPEQGAARPVRRVAVDAASLEETARQAPSVVQLEANHAGFLAPLVEAGSRRFHLWPLRREEAVVGLLCLGFVEGAEGAPGPASHAFDIAERLSLLITKGSQVERLYRQAHFDPLTSLPNRSLFRERLGGELIHANEVGGQGALLYIDLDEFKRVNDAAGHAVGDELLQLVGQRLAACVKEGDTVARLGGDEFAVILREVREPEMARAIAERIQTALGQVFSLRGQDHFVCASIGITLFPRDGQSIEELLRNGDVAMYRAKELGRRQIVFFEPEMNARVEARAALETQLHVALREDQFDLHFQPVLDGAQRRVLGVEALLRWPTRENDERLATSFIRTAESSGLIVEIGWGVLEAAARSFNDWRRRGHALPYVAVNASARQLREPDFVERVAALLERQRLPARCLQVEIAESVLAESGGAPEAVARLAALGCRIALDDFGAGTASLGHVQTFPIRAVKVDRSLVAALPRDAAAAKLVETILLMGRSLEKEVIAEGVETAEQLEFLRSRGCIAMQGRLLADPMPGGALLEFLARLGEESRAGRRRETGRR